MSPSRSCHPGSPRAVDLADLALDQPPGAAVLLDADRRSLTLPPASHRYGALVGVSCPAAIDGVATTHDALLTVDGRRRSVVIGVAVTRSGSEAARFRPPGGGPRTLHDLEGPLVDIGRRALGLTTPPCPRTPLELLDAAFAESVLRLLLDAELGWRPTWAEISVRHPLADHTAISPGELCARRRELGSVSWSYVRQRVVSQQSCPDRELTPTLARWLDDGSLARWLFARYPEPGQVFADVCDLLDSHTAGSFRVAHAPVRDRAAGTVARPRSRRR